MGTPRPSTAVVVVGVTLTALAISTASSAPRVPTAVAVQGCDAAAVPSARRGRRDTGTGLTEQGPCVFAIPHDGSAASGPSAHKAATTSSGVIPPVEATGVATLATTIGGTVPPVGTSCTLCRWGSRHGTANEVAARHGTACRCTARARPAYQDDGPGAPPSTLTPTSGASGCASPSRGGRASATSTALPSLLIAI